ncbi:MAG: hypothetical protein RI978_461, partial [Verrucomicrobiota bacterium]
MLPDTKTALNLSFYYQRLSGNGLTPYSA